MFKWVVAQRMVVSVSPSKARLFVVALLGLACADRPRAVNPVKPPKQENKTRASSASQLYDCRGDAFTSLDLVQNDPIHGLDALATRRGPKPSGIDISERAQFFVKGPNGSHEIWRLTSDPAVDRHDYYYIPAWNENGRFLLFQTRRKGYERFRWWLMTADGGKRAPLNLDPLMHPQEGHHKYVQSVYWHPHWANALLALIQDKAKADASRCSFMLPGIDASSMARLRSYSLRKIVIDDDMSVDAEESETLVEGICSLPGTKRTGDWGALKFIPPHHSGQWMALISGGDNKKTTRLVWFGFDDTGRLIRESFRQHQMAFHTHRAMFSGQDQPSLLLKQSPKGNRRLAFVRLGGLEKKAPRVTRLDKRFPSRETQKNAGHPAIEFGTGILTLMQSGYMREFDVSNGRLIKNVVRVKSHRTHGGPSPMGNFYVGDSLRGPLGSHLFAIPRSHAPVKDVDIGRYRLIKHGACFAAKRADRIHRRKIYPGSSHPHAQMSPDETKILFTSDWLGVPTPLRAKQSRAANPYIRLSDLYYLVYKRPLPPSDIVRVGRRLTWNTPRPTKELRRYNIYSRTDEKASWQYVDSVDSTRHALHSVLLPYQRYQYGINSEEWSGLQSQIQLAVPSGKALANQGLRLQPTDVCSIAKTAGGVPYHEVRWRMPGSSYRLRYFNVYSSDRAGATPSLSGLLGSPLATHMRTYEGPGSPCTLTRRSGAHWWDDLVFSFVDWGRSHRVKRHYLVQAVDHLGRVSKVSVSSP